MTESYRSIIADMKKWYPLNEWKEIDYDAIDAEVFPMVQEAEKTNDYALYSQALAQLTRSIPDSHVVYTQTVEQEGSNKLWEASLQDYYGLVLFTTDDGKTRAFGVDEQGSAYKAGIRSGTVITHWGGKPIAQALREVVDTVYQENYPVQENEDYLKPICLSGTGGQEVEVGFIDSAGQTKTVRVYPCQAVWQHFADAQTRQWFPWSMSAVSAMF